MEDKDRELQTQIALIEVMKELDLGLESETDEIYDQSIFSYEYRPLDSNGCENGRRRRILNIRKSNVFNLVKKTEIDAVKIDELLLEKNGLNVLPNIRKYDAPEFRPVLIHRKLPLDYGKFVSLPMAGIRADGVDETYLEVSWVEKKESCELFDYIRRFDPTFQLLDSEKQKELTKRYNKKLKKMFMGTCIVESVRIIENSIGHHRSVFDFRGLHNLRRELASIQGVNRNNYLTTEIDWLGMVQDDLGGFAYSTFQIQKTELNRFQTYFKDSLEKMLRNLKLENSRFWDRERDEPGVYIAYLKEILICYRVYAEMNAEASDRLFGQLRDMAKDFGCLLESVIDQLVILYTL